MKHLYLGEDNVMNYLFIRDSSRDDLDTYVVSWDLSDDEIAAAENAFRLDRDTTEFYDISVEDMECSDFETFLDCIGHMNSYKLLV